VKNKGQYCEATVLSHDNRGTYIEWHDGTRERVFKPVDDPIKDFERGTLFGAKIRFGEILTDFVVEITEVKIIKNDE
jgi:hypothetical protein